MFSWKVVGRRCQRWLCLTSIITASLLVERSRAFSPSVLSPFTLSRASKFVSRSHADYMQTLNPRAQGMRLQSLQETPVNPSADAQTLAAETWLTSRGEGQEPQTRIPPSWLLSRQEWESIFNRYYAVMKHEGSGFEELTQLERSFLSPELLQQRMGLASDAVDVNADFFTRLIQHIPTVHQFFERVNRRSVHEAAMWSPEAFTPPAPVVDIFHAQGVSLDRQHYASFGSLCLHLFRDWSSEADHVRDSVNRPIIEEIKRRLPITGNGPPPRILVPGAALSRLPFELMMEGYEVECNEFSAMFVHAVDYLFNMCSHRMDLYPLAHLFVDNNDIATQYTKLQVPSRLPLEEAARAGRRMRLSAGDFVQLYGAGGAAHRKFDAVLTCFFIDTGDSVFDYVDTIDQVLEDGGHWINLGPLAYDKSVRLKLSWEELQSVWERRGYEFLSVQQKHTAYYLQPGVKLSTEQFDAVFATAVKHASRQAHSQH